MVKHTQTIHQQFTDHFAILALEGLKTHKPLSLAIISDLLRLTDIGGWSVERDTSISVFFIDSCNLWDKKIIKPLLYHEMRFWQKVQYLWDSANLTQLKTFN